MNEQTKIRLRGNIKTTTKNEYTIDATVEIDGIEIDSAKIEGCNEIEATMQVLLDKLASVAESKGYQRPIDK